MPSLSPYSFPLFVALLSVTGAAVFLRELVNNWKLIKEYVVESPPPAWKLDRSGWVLSTCDWIARHANLLSLSQWLRFIVIRLPRDRVDGTSMEVASVLDRFDRCESRLIDTYVVLTTGFLGVCLAFHSELARFPLAVAGYVLLEMMIRTINVVLFDNLGGHPPIASAERSLLLFILNAGQVVIGFAVIRLQCPQSFPELNVKAAETGSLGALWQSVQTSAVFDLPKVSGLGPLIVSAQVLVSLWLIVVFVAWLIGNLSKRV